jgi:hypothetical protein
MSRVKYFGIRHHSPAGAWHLREFLDEVRPELILVEGPSDFTDLIGEITGKKAEPPFAVMAYTEELPIRTLLYPLAVYSPEYQALLWGAEHGCECRFIDLPSEVFLGLWEREEMPENPAEERGQAASGEPDDTFWERVLENSRDAAAYREGAALFGRSLREIPGRAGADNELREAYMRDQIRAADRQGFSADQIAVITGAYHTAGLAEESVAQLPDLAGLPRKKGRKTLMPYSYYRLSEHSGYGAGNPAPAYYEFLWEAKRRGEPEYAAYRYLTGIAGYQRAHGQIVSSAEVIEAMRLAAALAKLRGGSTPVLKDLRDAAVTCLGHGSFSELAMAFADTEVGTKIGRLPEGIGQTSIQADFYRELERLKLDSYKTASAKDLRLDLREKRTVQSRASAFLDRERSFFLHRLRVLGIRFAVPGQARQEKATWAEDWVLQWTPEAEIQIVEAVLKGDTVAQAAAFSLKEQAEAGTGITTVAEAVRNAFLCGLPEAADLGVRTLQAMAADAAGVEEMAETISQLSMTLQYGDIRELNRDGLIPILEQLFLRSCLLLSGECACDDAAAKRMASAIGWLNEAEQVHDFLEEERWLSVLSEIAGRDDRNTKLSGLAAAILLERGRMDSEELSREVERRLSKGMPAELGAGWFEGLSMRNHYALIARLSLWESLSRYLDTLDDEEFKRSLVFLRRAFSDFHPAEKDQIAENLGEIWQVNPVQVSEILNETLSEEDRQMLEGLEDFDFGDI